MSRHRAAGSFDPALRAHLLLERRAGSGGGADRIDRGVVTRIVRIVV
jgi:hypothetical protein